MTKVKGHNARLYLGADLVAATSEVSINMDTDIEEVTDADSGIWAENEPTLNRWNVDITAWYHNAVGAGKADFSDVLAAYKTQERLTLKYQLETGVDVTGEGFLTNLQTSGGTGAGHITFTAGFIGTGPIS